MKVKSRDIILKHTSSSLLLLPHIKPCHLFSRGDIFILALPGGLWCLSSPTKDQTRALCSGKAQSNNWTTREFPRGDLYFNVFTNITYISCTNIEGFVNIIRLFSNCYFTVWYHKHFPISVYFCLVSRLSLYMHWVCIALVGKK